VSKAKTVEEKRADLIIKYRSLKVEKEEQGDQSITYHLSRGEERYVMRVLLDQDTIGIAFVRELRDLVKETGASKGILVGNGKYTYSARSSSPELGVELIPPSLPTFDVFSHDFVPMAEIVGEEERRRLVEKYHAEPYQYPWIKSSDPISIILGAKPGDVIKITSKSETAGVAESYRYVV
jgi:DNA-directed RNA polymerase subunit H